MSSSGEGTAEEVRLTVALGDGDVERIARRTAEIVGAAATTSESPYLTVAEAASYLRCARQRVYDLVSQGSLTRLKDGARLLLLRAEIDDYLAGTPRTWPKRPIQASRSGPKSTGSPIAATPTLFPADEPLRRTRS